MTLQSDNVPSLAAEPRGDAAALLARLGVPDEVEAAELAALALPQRRINSLPALRGFLHEYGRDLLIPLELPAIRRAWAHASRNETRELLALDRQMAGEAKLKEFAAASCRVGQRQLNRLRPLRDLRLVRRYREAIERGEAHGWHTLVYGVALSVYSLPLRQGLALYANRTLRGFIEQAAGPLALTAGHCDELHEEVCAQIPSALKRILDAETAGAPKVVE